MWATVSINELPFPSINFLLQLEPEPCAGHCKVPCSSHWTFQVVFDRVNPVSNPAKAHVSNLLGGGHPSLAFPGRDKTLINPPSTTMLVVSEATIKNLPQMHLTKLLIETWSLEDSGTMLSLSTVCGSRCSFSLNMRDIGSPKEFQERDTGVINRSVVVYLTTYSKEWIHKVVTLYKSTHISQQHLMTMDA